MAKEEKFTIYCSECKQEVEPVSYFNGELYCPNCRTRFVDRIGENARSAEDPREINKEEFALSQQFFMRYLFEIVPKLRECVKNGDSEEFDRLSEVRKEYLNQTISYCKHAAYNGNPNALLNLAYYYKAGYDQNVRNRDIAADRLCKLLHDVFGESSEFGEEIKTLVASRIQSSANETVVAQAGNGFEYFCKLLQDGNDPSLERTPLFGIASIRYQELTGEERALLLEYLARAAKDWSNDKYCGLYYFDGTDFKTLYNKNVDSVIDENIFAGRTVTHFVYRNVNFRCGDKRCEKSAREIVTSKNIVRDFFARLFDGVLSQDEDCTISFCDWDAYICKDVGAKGKFDDLIAEIAATKN